jgi:hypothetical protein
VYFPFAPGSPARMQSAHGNRLGTACIDFCTLFDNVNRHLRGPDFADIGNNGLHFATAGYDEVTGIDVLDLKPLSKTLGSWPTGSGGPGLRR